MLLLFNICKLYVLLRVGSRRVCWWWSHYCWSPYRHIWAHRRLTFSKWPRVRVAGLHIVFESFVTHHFVHRLVKKLTHSQGWVEFLVVWETHFGAKIVDDLLRMYKMLDYDWCKPKLKSLFYTIQNLTYLAKHTIIVQWDSQSWTASFNNAQCKECVIVIELFFMCQNIKSKLDSKFIGISPGQMDTNLNVYIANPIWRKHCRIIIVVRIVASNVSSYGVII